MKPKKSDEQLRALEHAAPIRVVMAKPAGPGIDTPADLRAAEAFFRKAGKKR